MSDALKDPNPKFLKQNSCWIIIIWTLYKSISNIFLPVLFPEEFEKVEEPACANDTDFSAKATVSDTDPVPSSCS